jgi:hypothetical protein
VTALVGKIGADTATIARHSATIPTRIDLPSPRRRGGSTRGGNLGEPPAAGKACATECYCRSTRVDRVDILAGSALISRGIAASSGERGGILHASFGL